MNVTHGAQKAHNNLRWSPITTEPTGHATLKEIEAMSKSSQVQSGGSSPIQFPTVTSGGAGPIQVPTTQQSAQKKGVEQLFGQSTFQTKSGGASQVSTQQAPTQQQPPLQTG